MNPFLKLALFASMAFFVMACELDRATAPVPPAKVKLVVCDTQFFHLGYDANGKPTIGRIVDLSTCRDTFVVPKP